MPNTPPPTDLQSDSESDPVLARLPQTSQAVLNWIIKHYVVCSLAAILITSIVVVWKVNDMTQSLLRDTALRDVGAYSDAVRQFRTLYSSEVIGRLQEAGADVNVTHDYRNHRGAIPLPATLSKLLGDRLGDQQSQCETRLFSDYPFPHRDDGGPQDSFERQALAALRKNPKQPYHAFETVNGETFLRYATADQMRQSCVQCHNTHPQSPKTDWKKGDVRGVLALRMPMKAAMAHTKAEVRGALWVFSGVGGMLVGLFFLTTFRLHRQSQKAAISNQQLALSSRQLKQAKSEIDATNAGLRAKTNQLERSRQAALNLTRDMRASRDKAEAAVYAKGQFLAMMSHEIRTPMTAILGYAESLDEMLSDEECLDTVATIRRNGEHLLHLINDILDLSKIEANKFAIEQIYCSPRDLLFEVYELMRIRAEQKGLEWCVENDGPLPQQIQSDPARLRQILINLVGNAIKFTEDGSVVLTARLTSVNGESQLEFAVKDTGIGLSQEQRRGLFEPFAQADNSMARKYGGTGLGLTISKRLAELLGGSIDVQSEEGQGSTFTARVATGPLENVPQIDCLLEAGERDEENDGSKAAVSDAPTFDSPQTNSESAASPLTGLTVLVVEDGVDNQRLIRWILTKAGAEVAVEENGELGSQAAMQAQRDGRPFDVILMDMQMPVMDGYTAAALLRENDCQAPIIALTAHAMAEDRKKCLAAGCDGFATKPFQRNELIEIVSSFGFRSTQDAPTTSTA